jgi:hypothetical protein
MRIRPMTLAAVAVLLVALPALAKAGLGGARFPRHHASARESGGANYDIDDLLT